MSQLTSFDNPRKSQQIANDRSAFYTVGSDSTTSGIVTSLLGELFEFYSKNLQPVKVVNDTIKVKEYLLEENEPYAFQYNDKDYVQLISKPYNTSKMMQY